MSGESKDFTGINKEAWDKLTEEIPEIPRTINVGDPCKVRNCVAITCKYNVGRKCSLEEINIGPKAQNEKPSCLEYVERKI